MDKRRIVLQFIGSWRRLRVHLQTNIQRSNRISSIICANQHRLGYSQSSTVNYIWRYWRSILTPVRLVIPRAWSWPPVWLS